MTAITTLYVSGDTAPDLTGTLTSGTTPVSLTGATIELHLLKPDKTVIDRAAVIVDAAAGTWRYTWQAGELVVGTWAVEAEVTFTSGAIQTFPAAIPAYFQVRAQLA